MLVRPDRWRAARARCRAARGAGILAASLVAGCAAADDPGGVAKSAGPTIALVDSIVLAESSSDPLGGYTAFFGFGPSGGVLVSDIAGGRVLRFDTTGAYLGAMGRAGEGPGEFRLPSEIIPLVDEGAVGVLDGNRSRLILFSDSTGEFMREVVIPFQRAGPGVVRDGNSMVMAPLLASHPLFQWNMVTDSFTPLGAELDPGIPGWQSMIMASGIPGVVQVDSALLVWQPALGLMRYRLNGERPDMFEVPALRRRGEGLERMAAQAELRRAERDSTVLSIAVGIGRLSSGEVVLGSVDARRTRVGDYDVRESEIRVFLSVVDPKLQRVCVDGLVPLITEASSVMVSRDGAVHFLARQVTDAGAVRSVVYRYRVDPSECERLPLVAEQP